MDFCAEDRRSWTAGQGDCHSIEISYQISRVAVLAAVFLHGSFVPALRPGSEGQRLVLCRAELTFITDLLRRRVLEILEAKTGMNLADPPRGGREPSESGVGGFPAGRLPGGAHIPATITSCKPLCPELEFSC